MKPHIQPKISTKQNILISSIVISSCLIGIPLVEAQSQNPNDTSSSQIEEMVVTGSRIRRPGLDTIRPAISVDSSLLGDRAFTNIADALSEVPTFGAGIDPNGAQNAFTVGQNFVDLFDLGSQRTLTLVDGKRFVSSNTPSIFGSESGFQVDINSIPVALVDRIEVVPLAGAAVYGSDAIGGVVNVILKEDFEGFEASFQTGITEEGDGETYQYQIVMGTNFSDNRGNITFSLEHDRQEGLLLNERPSLVNNNPGFLNFGGLDLDGDGNDDDLDGDGLPDSFDVFTTGGQVVQLLSAGGAVSVPPAFFAPSAGIGALADGNFYQFQPNGDLEACTPGETPAGSIFFAYGGTCGEDFFDNVAQIRSPLSRNVATIFSNYDISENVKFKQSLIVSNTEADELVNQGGFQSFPFSGTSGPVSLAVSNPLLNDQARGILQANGLTSFNINRFNNDLVSNGIDSTENFTWRSTTSLEGSFEFAERNFYWDITAVFGQSDVETQTTGIIDGRFTNALNTVTLNQASLQPVIDQLTNSNTDLNGDGAIDVNDALIEFISSGGSGVADLQLGSIVCQANIDATTGTLDGANTPPSFGGITDEDSPFVEGCVPLNLFGQGAASPQALAFINGGPSITSSDIGQTVYTANLSGDAFDLPAGTIQFAIGYENREETASFVPGLGASIPITRSSSFPTTAGRLNTSEFYGELLIPVLSQEIDLGSFDFIELAEFSASIRNVNNTITDPNGVENEDNANAWEIGGRIKPYKGLSIRGTLTQAIRTPSLVELFSPQVQAFISGADPCDNREINAGPNPDVRRANCISAGITDPDNFTSNIQNSTIMGATGGNPNLITERSRSSFVGLEYLPEFSFLENLTFQLDFFNIEIEDRIENFDFEALAETCFDSTSFPNSACSQFTRDDTGQVVDVSESFLNAANSEVRGFVSRITYESPLSDLIWFSNKELGIIEFDLSTVRTFSDITQVVPTRPGDQDAGDFFDPSFEGTFDVTWEKGPYRVFYRIQFQDAPDLDETGDDIFLSNFDPDDLTATTFVSETRPRIFQNISFTYNLEHLNILGDTTLQLSIDNLTNRQPDPIELAIGYVSVTEQLGRRFNFRIRSTF